MSEMNIPLVIFGEHALSFVLDMIDLSIIDMQQVRSVVDSYLALPR